MSDEWVTVGAKNKPRRRPRPSAGSLGGNAAGGSQQPEVQQQQALASGQTPTGAQVARWCSLVSTARGEVAASPFFRNLQSTLAGATLPPSGDTDNPKPLLGSIDHMVVWGLGALDCGLVHIRYQLALAQQLLGLLPSVGKQGVEAYDPVFTQLDMAVLIQGGIQVTPNNPDGRHVASVPTLFYLPHCELELTERLLGANVAAGTLCHLAVLGNSFELYRERWELTRGHTNPPRQEPHVRGRSSKAKLETQLGGLDRGRVGGQGQQQGEQRTAVAEDGSMPALEGLACPDGLLCDLVCCGAVKERPVSECSFPVASAFNDMALHTFVADWRERLTRQRGI